MSNALIKHVLPILRLAIWIMPIPFGAAASGNNFLSSAGLLVFLLASLSLPSTVRCRQMKRAGTSAYASVGSLLYGGLIALCIAVGMLNGLMAYEWWHDYVYRTAAFFIWMLITISLQYAMAWGIETWRASQRMKWYSEFLDPVLYSLPLPCAVMGMLLFPAVSGPVTSSLVIGVMGIMGFGFLAMGIWVIAVFAFYFFPSKALPVRKRVIQIIRIVVMTIIWLGSNHVIFNSDMQIFSTVVFRFMPVVQNNILVFVTPFVLESILIMAAVAVANIAVMAGTAWRR